MPKKGIGCSRKAGFGSKYTKFTVYMLIFTISETHREIFVQGNAARRVSKCDLERKSKLRNTKRNAAARNQITSK